MRSAIFFLLTICIASPSIAGDCPSPAYTWDVGGLDIAIHPTGTTLALPTGPGASILLIDLADRSTRTVGVGALVYPRAVAYHESGNLFVLDNNETVVEFDERGHVVRSWTAAPSGVSMTVAGDRVYILGRATEDTGVLRSWNRFGGDVRVEHEELSGYPLSVTVKPDGTILVAYLTLVNGFNYTVLHTVPVVGSENAFVGLFRVRATHDGGLLLSSANEIRILDSNYTTQCALLESGDPFVDTVADGAGHFYTLRSGGVVDLSSVTPVERSSWGALKARLD